MSPSIFTSVINSYLPEPHASLLNGILFGVSVKTTAAFYEQLKQVGLLHIVVLSGINITILATIVGSLTKSLKKGAAIFITITVIVVFVLFVGPQAPIIRAAIMGILALWAVVLGRKTYALYALFLSLLITAVFWPKWITTISLQLSYAATLGIILFGQAQTKKARSGFLGQLTQTFWREFKPSIAAQLFTVPLIFAAFKQVSPIAPVSNIFVSFLIAPLMIFGFLTAILGKINYWFGLIPSYICLGILSYMVFVVETLSKIPFGYFKF